MYGRSWSACIWCTPTPCKRVGTGLDRVEHRGRFTVGERDDQLRARCRCERARRRRPARARSHRRRSHAADASNQACARYGRGDRRSEPTASRRSRPAGGDGDAAARRGGRARGVHAATHALRRVRARPVRVPRRPRRRRRSRRRLRADLRRATTTPPASAALGVEQGGLAWYVAAIRECFEEAGVLLARPPATRRRRALRRSGCRRPLQRRPPSPIHAGERTLVELCVREDLLLLTVGCTSSPTG